jgi:hypothetical protein
MMPVEREDDMTSSQVSTAGPGPDSKAVIIGVTLMGIGGAFIAAGLALSGVAMVTGLRRWIDEMDQPPSALAKQTWAQAKAATAAGAKAWQDEHSLQHA